LGAAAVNVLTKNLPKMIPTSYHTRRHLYSLKRINNALKPKPGSPLEAMLKDALVDTSTQQINKDMQEDLLLLHAAQKNIEAAIIALEHYLERCI
jgi:hypothetical protein